jgi:hypothetical protein
MKKLNGIIIINGIYDSILINKIEKKLINYTILTQNSKNNKYSDIINFINNAQLKYTFEDRLKLPTIYNDIPIFWIILYKKLHGENEFYYSQRILELSAFYGIPIIYINKNTDDIIYKINDLFINNNKMYNEIHNSALQNFDDKYISKYDIENIMFEEITDIMMIISMICDTNYDMDIYNDSYYYPDDLPNYLIQPIKNACYVKKSCLFLSYNFFDKKQEEKYIKMLFIKKFINKFKEQILNKSFDWNYLSKNIQKIINNKPCLMLVKEGSNKKIYRFISNDNYLNKQCIIQYKKKYNVDKIKEIQMFIDILHRNNLYHCYTSINDNYIIFSKYLEDMPKIKIIVKKECLGNDKRSFYGVQYKEIYNINHELYVRFDWKNSYQNIIKKKNNIIYTDIIENENININMLKHINIDKIKENSIKIFLIIQLIFNKIGLDIQMCEYKLDNSGDIFLGDIYQKFMFINYNDHNLKLTDYLKKYLMENKLNN